MSKQNQMLSFVVAVVIFTTTIPLTVCGMGTSSATYTANGEYMTGVTDSRGNTTEYTYNESRGYVDYVTNAKDK